MLQTHGFIFPRKKGKIKTRKIVNKHRQINTTERKTKIHTQTNEHAETNQSKKFSLDFINFDPAYRDRQVLIIFLLYILHINQIYCKNEYRSVKR